MWGRKNGSSATVNTRSGCKTSLCYYLSRLPSKLKEEVTLSTACLGSEEVMPNKRYLYFC